MMNNPYEQYRQNNIMLSSPEKLVLLVYEGLVRFIRAGKSAIEKRDFEVAHSSILKAQNIVSELTDSLDPDVNISDSLESLYDYMYGRLVEANVHKDQDVLEEVEGLAVELRDTWQEALTLQRA